MSSPEIEFVSDAEYGQPTSAPLIAPDETSALGVEAPRGAEETAAAEIRLVCDFAAGTLDVEPASVSLAPLQTVTWIFPAMPPGESGRFAITYDGEPSPLPSPEGFVVTPFTASVEIGVARLAGRGELILPDGNSTGGTCKPEDPPSCTSTNH